MKLILTIKEPTLVAVELREGRVTIGEESLTISQEFDTLLIRVIDKLLASTRIDRLSLKSLEIRGKLRSGAVSWMTIKTIKSALGA